MKATLADFALARANIFFQKVWTESKPVDARVMYRLTDERFKYVIKERIDIKDLRNEV